MASAEEEPEEQEAVPRVTNVWDACEVKRVLDECASQVPSCVVNSAARDAT